MIRWHSIMLANPISERLEMDFMEIFRFEVSHVRKIQKIIFKTFWR